MFKRLRTLLLPVAILAAVFGGVSANAMTLPETRVGGYQLVDAASRQVETTQTAESQQATGFSWYDTASECSVAAKSETFEIIDGVRRAKANQLLGNQAVPANIFNAEGNLVGQGNIPVGALRSPNKSVIDMSTQVQADRYMRIQNGLQQGSTLPPISVTPGTRGVSIEDILFDATGGAR
jgi:hypothetical protein